MLFSKRGNRYTNIQCSLYTLPQSCWSIIFLVMSLKKEALLRSESLISTTPKLNWDSSKTHTVKELSLPWNAKRVCVCSVDGMHRQKHQFPKALWLKKNKNQWQMEGMAPVKWWSQRKSVYYLSQNHFVETSE